MGLYSACRRKRSPTSVVCAAIGRWLWSPWIVPSTATPKSKTSLENCGDFTIPKSLPSPVSPRPLGFLVTRLHAFLPPRSSYFHRNLLSPLSLCRDTYTRPESERHKLVTRRWVYLPRTLRRCCMVWYVFSNCVWLTNLTCLLVIHGNLSDITRWSCGVFGVKICECPVFRHVTYGNLQCCLYSIVQIERDTIISRQLGWLIDQEY